MVINCLGLKGLRSITSITQLFFVCSNINSKSEENNKFTYLLFSCTMGTIPWNFKFRDIGWIACLPLSRFELSIIIIIIHISKRLFSMLAWIRLTGFSSCSRSTVSFLCCPSQQLYLCTLLHHAIITASLYMAKPPQATSSNAVPNAIKAKMLPQS